MVRKVVLVCLAILLFTSISAGQAQKESNLGREVNWVLVRNSSKVEMANANAVSDGRIVYRLRPRFLERSDQGTS